MFEGEVGSMVRLFMCWEGGGEVGSVVRSSVL